jgi:hypothetical protein
MAISSSSAGNDEGLKTEWLVVSVEAGFQPV